MLARAAGIPASTIQANWPQWQYDAAHSGFNPNEKTLSPSNISQLTPAWQFTGKVSGVSSPIVANGVVYFIEGQYLYGRDAQTGARKMTKVVNGFATPSFSNGLLYITMSQGLMAINTTTSRIIWQFSGTVSPNPIIAGNFVYIIGGTSGKLTLYSLNAATGTLKWNNTKITGGTSPLAVAGGVIYAGLQSGTVDAVFAGNGKIKWTAPIGTSTIPFLSVANGVLYTSAKNNFLAIDAATGSLLFQQSLGSLVRGTSITSPAIVNGMVYITTKYDWTLYAFHLPS